MATAAALADWSVRRRWGVCSVRDFEVGLGAVAWWQRRRDLNPQPVRMRDKERPLLPFNCRRAIQ